MFILYFFFFFFEQRGFFPVERLRNFLIVECSFRWANKNGRFDCFQFFFGFSRKLHDCFVLLATKLKKNRTLLIFQITLCSLLWNQFLYQYSIYFSFNLIEILQLFNFIIIKITIILLLIYLYNYILKIRNRYTISKTSSSIVLFVANIPLFFHIFL